MAEEQENRLPLDGVVVADFTRILAGPLATMVLADLGADVIKVERPSTGDDTRTWGPPFLDGDAAYFLSINRNKRSIALDLTDDADAEIAREIIRRSDILVENFRTGVMAKFGLAFKEVQQLNPKIIYCSVPAFSHTDRRNLPGYDLLMQAMSGFMSITGESGREPVKTGVAVLDVVAGLYCASAILAALHGRGSRDSGRLIEVGLFEASVSSLVNQAANYLVGGDVPSAAGNAHPNIVPYQAFVASDGRFVLAAANDKLFRAACHGMGRPDLAKDERYASNSARVNHRSELVAEMQAAFSEDTVEHWMNVFAEAGVPVAPVRSIDEVFDSPEGASMIDEIADPNRGSLRLVRSPIVFPGAAPSGSTPPPLLGEHTAEIREWIERTRGSSSSVGS